MFKNILFDTYPIVFHAPGPIQWSYHWNKVAKINCQLDDCNDLSIITWNNGCKNIINGKQLGTFEKSLNNLKHTVLCKDLVHWSSNRLKLQATIDYLKTCPTPYVMGADSLDVLIKGQPQEILDRFLTMDCEMLFNAERTYFPSGQLLWVEKFENSIKTQGLKHLNGGLWIGKTATCLEVFEKAAKKDKGPGYEQILLKQVYCEVYPRLKLDHCCNIFQILTDLPAWNLQVSSGKKFL